MSTTFLSGRKFHHKVVKTPAEAAALAVNNGCDLNCGSTYLYLDRAVEQGLITEEAIDHALERLFMARFQLGMFDPPEVVPFAQIPYEVNGCPDHQLLALQAAREAMVLLKNDGILPLSMTKTAGEDHPDIVGISNIKKIAVIGPNADNTEVLWGNYSGVPSEPISLLEGIRRRVSPQIELHYTRGCGIVGTSKAGFDDALEAVQKSDLVIVILGLSQTIEGEEGQEEGVQETNRSQGDRVSLDLPGVQEDLLKTIHAVGKPVVLVLVNGSAVAINWAAEYIPAILEAWYPGQAGGQALAEVLFGDYNPAGRLPVTFYKSVNQLPPFDDYAMQGRTYRYFTGEPLFPFGFGLSYTRFEYRNLLINPIVAKPEQEVAVQVEVQNTGGLDGDEVIQLYIRHLAAAFPTPRWNLCGFKRVHLAAGEVKTIRFNLTPDMLALINETGQAQAAYGKILISVGGSLPAAGVQTLLSEFDIR